MQKYTLLQYIVAVVLGICSFLPQSTEAVSVPISYSSTQSLNGVACGPIPQMLMAVPTWDTCAVANISTYISLTKNFGLIRGGQLLSQYNPTINVGDTVSGYAPPTVGSFTAAGSGYGTPPLDNTTIAYLTVPLPYQNAAAPIYNNIWTLYPTFRIWGGIADGSTYTLTSSNPAAINCAGTTCTAVGPGSANIIANFNPGGSFYYVYRDTQYIPPSGNLTLEPTNPIYFFLFGYSWPLLLSCNGLPEWWFPAISANAWRCTFPGATMPYAFAQSPITNPVPVTYYNVTSVVPNSPPTVSNVRAEDISYTEATIRWNYSDPENNPQTQAQVQVSRDAAFTNIVTNISINNSSPEQRVTTGLVAGTQYYIRARATDGQSGRILNTAPWVNGTPFRTIDYPIPTVNYTLRNGSNTANPGQTLQVSSGDRIDIEWNITNNEGLTQCNAVTETVSGGGNDQVFSGTNIGFTGARLQVEPPLVTTDRTYRLRITCPSRATGQAVSPEVNQFITLRVLTRPVVSCTVQNSVVTSSNPIAKVNVTVINGGADYAWQTDNGSGTGFTPAVPVSGNLALSNQTLDIDYSTTVAPGKYQPSVRVRDVNNRQDDAVCNSEVTNLGNRSIREVNP